MSNESKFMQEYQDVFVKKVAKNKQKRRNCRITVPKDYCQFPFA